MERFEVFGCEIGVQNQKLIYAMSDLHRVRVIFTNSMIIGDDRGANDLSDNPEIGQTSKYRSKPLDRLGRWASGLMISAAVFE